MTETDLQPIPWLLYKPLCPQYNGKIFKKRYVYF